MRLTDQQCQALSALNAGNTEPLLLDIVHSASRAHHLPDDELDSLVNYARAVQHERDTRRAGLPRPGIPRTATVCDYGHDAMTPALRCRRCNELLVDFSKVKIDTPAETANEVTQSILKQITDAAARGPIRQRQDIQLLNALTWIRREFDPSAEPNDHGGIDVTQRGWDAMTAQTRSLMPEATDALTRTGLTFTGIPIRIIDTETTTALAADEDTDDCD